MVRWRGNGEELTADLVGQLKDSTTLRGRPGALAARLAEDGYVFLRNVLPAAELAAARLEILDRLAEVGEVRPPTQLGRWSGTSRRAETAGDLGAFWKSVCEGPSLRRVSHGAAIRDVVAEVLGAEPVGHDFLYLRAGVRGTATDLHCDYPFFARRTENVVTCWVPLAPTPIEQGPLVVVENSHRFADLVEAARNIDVAAYPQKRAALDEPMSEFVRRRGARLLSADFEPGDIVVLSMFIVHASLDNHTADDAIRLSFDIRYQPRADARDERFFGPDPPGITGRGYAELNGAKPLGQSWHQR